MPIKSFEEAILSMIRDSLESQLEDLDFTDIMNDAAQEVIEDELNGFNLREEVQARMVEYAKHNVQYEQMITNIIDTAIADHGYII